jgi:tetratricopeptide (TPR) repeat protein
MVQDLLRKAVFSGLAAILCLSVAAQPRLEPPSPVPPFSAGLLFLSMEKYDTALPFFEEAIRENPRNAKAWLQAGLCLGKLGRTEAKLRAYRRAIAIDPAFAEAHYSLGISLLLEGEKCGAVHEMRALKALDPGLAGKLEALIDVMEGDDECAAGPDPEQTAI